MRQGYVWIGLVMAMMAGFVNVAKAEEISVDGMTIGSVEVVGNITLTRAQVLAAVRARPEQAFNAASVAEDVLRIARMDAVESSYYNTQIVDGRVILTYVVIEYNLVRSLGFEGNHAISDAVLVKELTFQKGDYLDVFAARAGIDALIQKYHKKGFPWIEITLQEAPLIRGEVLYQIQEGPHPKIADITFEGNESFSAQKLNMALKSKEKKLFLFSAYYDPEQVQADQVKLLEVYQKNSFLDAEVSHTVTFNEDKSKAFITFLIQEGPVYVVDSIRFQGNTLFTDEQLREEFKLREGFYYSEAWAQFDINKIKGRYGQEGYIEAKVALNRTFLPNSLVRVEFRIDEGNRYRIGEVSIVGNATLQDRSIRRILDEEGFTPGQWYNSEVARGDGGGELEQIVQRSVVAQSVQIQPVGDDPGARDAVVQITEGQTGSIMLGAGVASDSGIIGQVSLYQRNFDISDWPTSWGDLFSNKAFRGAGQQLQISASPGTRVSTYLVSFTEPYLYDQPIGMTVSGSSFKREREVYNTQLYDEGRMAAKLGFEKRYSDRWRRGISFRVENVDISSINPDPGVPVEITSVSGGNMLLGTRLYIRKDTTDNRYLPTRGYNFDAGYEQVFGEETFGILDGTYRWYKTLYEDLAENKTVLETKVYAAAMIGDAPVFEKFYLGGQSFRGFEYRGVSPRAGTLNAPVGSSWVLAGNTEVAIPLGNETFSWLFFTDAGVLDDGVIRASVGTGIQIQIPQFFGPVPMRFELASPIAKDDLDETRAFSFSVGALF